MKQIFGFFCRLFWTEEKCMTLLFHEKWEKREAGIRNLDYIGFDWQRNEEIKRWFPNFVAELKNIDSRFRRIAAEILVLLW